MKQHLVVKLRAGPVPRIDAPAWRRFINDKSRVITAFTPRFDAVMRESSLGFWVTQEYELLAPGGSADERAHGLERTYRIILQQDAELPDTLIARIAALPEVEQAFPIRVAGAELPTQGLASQASRGGAGDLIQLPYAKLMTRGRRDVTIAVLDTGVDINHPELRDRVTKRMDFVDLNGLDTSDFVGDFLGLDDVPQDEVGHGTHVSGIIAARGLKMDEGVAPDCSLMAVRVLATMASHGRKVGAGIVDNINAGIKYAVDNGADVINMSLGIRHAGGGLPHEDVIRYALAKGVTVVAASGNDGTSEKYYPGALDGVWAVGATDEDGAVAGFTSYGARIGLVAPGSRIYSAFADGGYATASGTSQAAPFVSGAVGLMKSLARQFGARLSHADLTRIFRHSCERSDGRLRTERGGYGALNLADALKYLAHELNGPSSMAR
ncbi:S8 family serine peptidase [Sphingomonas sp. PB2P19]|uniref:S8 family peptidase n=1 Tax=Sphingomonas rhamnosi TaxID=3096156 RepID=UPI002FC618BE